ncbi:MAG: hypothetical protein AAF244_00480 [Pseudomonadota bacterium]
MRKIFSAAAFSIVSAFPSSADEIPSVNALENYREATQEEVKEYCTGGDLSWSTLNIDINTAGAAEPFNVLSCPSQKVFTMDCKKLLGFGEIMTMTGAISNPKTQETLPSSEWVDVIDRTHQDFCSMAFV